VTALITSAEVAQAGDCSDHAPDDPAALLDA